MSDARAAIHAMFQLDEAGTAELDRRLDAVVTEALLKAGVQYVDCPVCGAAQPVAGECGNCTFKAWVAAEQAARGMAAPAEAAPEFFEVDRSYVSGTCQFRCEAITPSPGTGEVRALGWKRSPMHGTHLWHAVALDPDDWEHGGWTDVTEAGTR